MGFSFQVPNLLVFVDRVAANTNVNENVLVIIDDFAARIDGILQVDCGENASIDEYTVTKVFDCFCSSWQSTRSINGKCLHF